MVYKSNQKMFRKFQDLLKKKLPKGLVISFKLETDAGILKQKVLESF